MPATASGRRCGGRGRRPVGVTNVVTAGASRARAKKRSLATRRVVECRHFASLGSRDFTSREQNRKTAAYLVADRLGTIKRYRTTNRKIARTVSLRREPYTL